MPASPELFRILLLDAQVVDTQVCAGRGSVLLAFPDVSISKLGPMPPFGRISLELRLGTLWTSRGWLGQRSWVMVGVEHQEPGGEVQGTTCFGAQEPSTSRAGITTRRVGHRRLRQFRAK